MNMTDAQEAYGRLSLARKTAVLAWIMHELTIAARDTYEVGTEEIASGPRLRRFNELQHRLSAQVARYASGDSGGISDETVVKMIYDLGDDGSRLFEKVFERDGSQH